MRGGVNLGDPLGALLHRIVRIARRVGPDKYEDLAQTGAEAAIREIGRKSLSGREATRAAHSAMLSEVGKGANVGARYESSSIQKALNRHGETAGEFRLWSEVRKTHPGMSLDRFRRLRAGIGQKRQTSLDTPIRPGESETIGDMVRNAENPLDAALLKERFGNLTPQQGQNLDNYLTGKPVNRAIVDRILKKLEVRKKAEAPGEQPQGSEWYQRAKSQVEDIEKKTGMKYELGESQVPSKGIKPISGGAAGPEDLSAEFPSHAFRIQLGQQSRRMMDQAGPKLQAPDLAESISRMERMLAESGGGNRLAAGAIPESQHYTLGASRLTTDWDRLKNMFGNVGFFQGNN